MKKRKLVLALMLSLMLLVTMIPSFSFAEGESGSTGNGAASGTTSAVTSGNCGAEGDGSNVKWNFDESSGTLTISGSGAMADYAPNDQSGNVPAPWYAYRTSVKNIEISKGVTTIGNNAFRDAPVAKINIPEGITKIGDNAFRLCPVTAVLPASVTHLGTTAFFGDFNVVVDAQNASLETDENGIIYTKNKTKLIQAPQNITSDNLQIPATVTEIGNYAFFGCKGITGKLAIPAAVEIIGTSSFYQTKISSLQFSDNANLKEIMPTAFAATSVAGTITIPDGVETIGDRAFLKLPITSVVFPETLKSIGAEAFEQCANLTSVTFEKKAESLSIGTNAFYQCKNLENVKFPEIAEDMTIGDNAFRETLLNNVELTEGLRVIGETAFRDTPITYIAFPESLQKVGNSAFYYSKKPINDKIVYNMTRLSDEVVFESTNGKNCFVEWWKDITYNDRPLRLFYIQNENMKDKILHTIQRPIFAIVNGGTFKENTTFDTESLATPVKSGFKFLGWYANADFSGDKVTTPQAGKTYYANWEEKAEQEISFDKNAVTVHANEKNVTNPIKHTKGDGSVAYKSSNEDVAMVDSTTGEVTIKGAGTATITATAAETSAYKEASASYDLTVTAHDFSKDWEHDADGHWHACTVEGCAAKADAEAHDFQWVVDKEATTTEKGSKHEECKVCRFAKEVVEIPVIENGTTGGDQNNGNAGNGTTTDSKVDSANAANSAKTGDAMPIGMLAVLMLAAAAGIAVCGRKLYKSR